MGAKHTEKPTVLDRGPDDGLNHVISGGYTPRTTEAAQATGLQLHYQDGSVHTRQFGKCDHAREPQKPYLRPSGEHLKPQQEQKCCEQAGSRLLYTLETDYG